MRTLIVRLGREYAALKAQLKECSKTEVNLRAAVEMVFHFKTAHSCRPWQYVCTGCQDFFGYQTERSQPYRRKP